MKRLHRGLFPASLASLVMALVSGCAPGEFEPAVQYFAKERHVTDASARHASDAWDLRFNELIISDLDDAIRSGRAGNEPEMRRQAAQVIRAASSYAQQAAAGEIQRLPAQDRAALARKARTQDSADELARAYKTRADKRLAERLARIEHDGTADVLANLETLRHDIEPAPDDKKRTQRKLTLALFAGASKRGLEKVEAQRAAEQPQRLTQVFEQAVVWRPQQTDGDELARFAPTLAMEWPTERSYPADYDRFGEVYLTGDARHVDVNINTSRPIVYTYRSEAKIGDKRYPQIAYVWWYPFRPEMKPKDPAAGHIDGDTLRVTLDAKGRPAIFEVVQTCGCGHLIFVSSDVEKKAEAQFHQKEPDRKLFIEKSNSGKRDLVIGGVVDVPAGDVHPVVYILAGLHEVSGIDVETASRKADMKAVEQHQYSASDYDVLEHLPLAGGVGSMFGADGLVHNAGRPEGYLLAPTGMLSAGQPRKRGTQKIRWDEFSFDDPRLLEKTLRLPSEL